MKITLTKAVAKAHLLISPKHDIRYYLLGVLIDVDADGQGATVVSTDGHMLLATRLEPHEFEDLTPGAQVIVPRDALAKAGFIGGGSKGVLTITVTTEADRPDPEREGVVIRGRTKLELLGEVQLTCNPVDGTFPYWRRVLPAQINGQAASVNPRFWGVMGDVADLLLGKDKLPAIFQNGPSSPALITFGENSIGLVMPLREAPPPFPGYPAWAKPGGA